MNNIIDIHSHILHDLDDGPADLKTAIEMCRTACSNGTSDIIATPHIFHKSFDVDFKTAKSRFTELKKELKKEELSIEIHLGFECRINENLIHKLIKSPEYTLCGKGKYFLLELDSLFVPPPDFDTFIFESRSKGLRPILVHPERYYRHLKEITMLEGLVERGLQIQVTAASITGRHGKGLRKFTEKMLKTGIIHFVASDIHCLDSDEYELRDAYDRVTRLVGEERAKALFINNPRMIID